MKKMIFILVLLTVTAIAAFAQAGVIREMTGDVELKAAGASAFAPARVGSQVAQDTIVSTGFRSTALIEVGSTTITVRPLTRLSLKDIQSTAGEENLSVNLQTGRVRVEVKPAAGTRATTQVQTPSATASVRGTVFDMDTQKLDVHEGKVLFMGSDGLDVPVPAGSSSAVMLGAAVDPIIVAEGDLFPSSPVGSGIAGDQVAVQTIADNDNLAISTTWED